MRRGEAHWHHACFTALEVLVLAHLAAIAFYAFVKRDNLIAPMLTGRRRFPTDPGLAFAPFWRFAAAALIAAGGGWFQSNGLRL